MANLVTNFISVSATGTGGIAPLDMARWLARHVSADDLSGLSEQNFNLDLSVKPGCEREAEEALLLHFDMRRLADCPAGIAEINWDEDHLLALAATRNGDHDLCRLVTSNYNSLHPQASESWQQILGRHGLDRVHLVEAERRVATKNPHIALTARMAAGTHRKTGYLDARHWRLRNWGCNRHGEWAQIIPRDGEICLKFDTDNTPAKAFAEKLHARLSADGVRPDILFVAYEPDTDYSIRGGSAHDGGFDWGEEEWEPCAVMRARSIVTGLSPSELQAIDDDAFTPEQNLDRQAEPGIA